MIDDIFELDSFVKLIIAKLISIWNGKYWYQYYPEEVHRITKYRLIDKMTKNLKRYWMILGSANFILSCAYRSICDIYDILALTGVGWSFSATSCHWQIIVEEKLIVFLQFIKVNDNKCRLMIFCMEEVSLILRSASCILLCYYFLLQSFLWGKVGNFLDNLKFIDFILMWPQGMQT